jgi:hypothetical protein
VKIPANYNAILNMLRQELNFLAQALGGLLSDIFVG